MVEGGEILLRQPLAKMSKFVEKHHGELGSLCPERVSPIPIKFVAQPPNSPDLNVLDLGAWCSLQVAVECLRGERTTNVLTEDEILNACLKGWDEWEGKEKLEKLFTTLEKILAIVDEINGDNNYQIPH